MSTMGVTLSTAGMFSTMGNTLMCVGGCSKAYRGCYDDSGVLSTVALSMTKQRKAVIKSIHFAHVHS